MEEHEMKLEKEFKFAEAAQVRAKINQLKFLEEEKTKAELRKTHNDEVTQLEYDRQEALRSFNDEYDALYNDLIKKFEDMQSQLNEMHSNEYNEGMKEFNETFPEKNPKFSSEILDLYKKLEGIVKKKKYVDILTDSYEQAHEVHMRILELTNTHHQKWNTDTKEWKLQCKMQAIKTKQENEFNALKQKIESTLNEFNLKRKAENDK